MENLAGEVEQLTLQGGKLALKVFKAITVIQEKRSVVVEVHVLTLVVAMFSDFYLPQFKSYYVRRDIPFFQIKSYFERLNAKRREQLSRDRHVTLTSDLRTKLIWIYWNREDIYLQAFFCVVQITQHNVTQDLDFNTIRFKATSLWGRA